MRILELTLHNFRNYSDLSLKFEDGIHIIEGKNAQGKTNLLESIIYLSTMRSHRPVKDHDLIQDGKDFFVCRAKIMKEKSFDVIKVIGNTKGKNLFLFDTPIRSLSDFIGTLNAVMFCPDDMALFHASPKYRRKFIDVELSKLSKKYVHTLNKTYKLIKERNASLKKIVDDAYLDILDQQLIDLQVIIIRQRYFFLKNLLTKSEKFYKEFSNDQTNIDIQYISCIPYQDDLNQMKKDLKEKYLKSREKDKILKSTSIGIHKEDFIFMLSGSDVNTYASQGQKRSILLALKIAMIYMIYEIKNEYPVLLLDDVFSELDKERRNKLLIFLPKNIQIFISTTDLFEIESLKIERNIKFYHVEDGIVMEKK